MARRDGLEGCRRRVDARSSCTSREPVRRASMARAQPRRTRSATACRPRCAHAPPHPLPLRPMSRSECARCSSSRQSAQLYCCRWATRKTPNHLVSVSNHVRVRPEAAEWQAQRFGLRATRDATGGLGSAPWRHAAVVLAAQAACGGADALGERRDGAGLPSWVSWGRSQAQANCGGRAGTRGGAGDSTT